MGQSRPLFVYFHYFLDTISIIQIEKSVDGVLGILTRGRRMVGADKTTELWQQRIVLLLSKNYSLQVHKVDLCFMTYIRYNVVKVVFPESIRQRKCDDEVAIVQDMRQNRYTRCLYPWHHSLYDSKTFYIMFVSSRQKINPSVWSTMSPGSFPVFKVQWPIL